MQNSPYPSYSQYPSHSSYLNRNKAHITQTSKPSTVLQQQQIQQLQQKVDMILLHNAKLLQQNAQLQALLKITRQELDRKINYTDNGELYRLKREYDLKILQLERTNRELERVSVETIEERRSVCDQIQHLNGVIRNLSIDHDTLVMEKQELEGKLLKIDKDRDRELNRMREQLENQVYEQSLKKQIEYKEIIRDKQTDFNKKLQAKEKQWEEEKSQAEQQKMNTIINMQQRMAKQTEQVRRQIQNEYKQAVKKVETQANQKCRKARDQSQNYVKMMLSQQKVDSQQNQQELEKQIQSLKQSLAERQKIVQTLLKTSTTPNIGISYYEEVQELRNRIKQITQNFFKESQILKVKMATLHDLDVREMIKVYDNKIDVLTERITMTDEENTRLRQKYEDEIRSKMKQRHKFQIDVSKLKNYIRKMKIQLQSYGKEMRLNIQGIRDQANSFSMSIIGELGQEKNRKNFYEQEIRKMRDLVELKQKQMDVLISQEELKIKYYDDKLKHAKANIDDLTEQLDNKDEKFRDQFEAYRHSWNQQNQKLKSFYEEKLQEQIKQVTETKAENERLQEKCRQTQNEKNNTDKNLQRVQKQLDDCKAHIDAMRIQLEMMGETQLQAQRNTLKSHYDRVVDQLQKDKQILKQTNNLQAEQLAQLVGKYKLLQNSIKKTVSTMKKRTQLQQKVVELGMDNNLVKNLAEIFREGEY